MTANSPQLLRGAFWGPGTWGGNELIFYVQGGQYRFTVLHMEEDMQVMIITVALLIQEGRSTLRTYLCPPELSLYFV